MDFNYYLHYKQKGINNIAGMKNIVNVKEKLQS